MRARPHGEALHEQSKRLLAGVKAVDDAFSPYIVTKCRESNSKTAAANGPKQKDQEESLGQCLIRGDVKVSIILDWNAQGAEVRRREAL